MSNLPVIGDKTTILCIFDVFCMLIKKVIIRVKFFGIMFSWLGLELGLGLRSSLLHMYTFSTRRVILYLFSLSNLTVQFKINVALIKMTFVDITSCGLFFLIIPINLFLMACVIGCH